MCRCHNNKVPAGQFVCKWHWAWPDIPASTTGPGCHGNAQLFPKSFLLLFPPPTFFFLLCRGKGHGSISLAGLHGVIPTGVKKRGGSVSKEVQLDFLNWCEVMIGSVLPDSTDDRRARRLRWSEEGCFGQGRLTASHRDPRRSHPSAEPWMPTSQAETENSKCPAGSRPPLHELKVTTRTGL